jgi:hypothetical protein
MKRSKPSPAASFLLALLLPLGAAGAEPASPPASPAEAFFRNLAAYCGRSFEGRVLFTTSQDFEGKKLVAHLASCGEKELRIPFQVGEDRSRTWIVTLEGDRLRLKHDHRHPDGTLDEITNYGGDSDGPGTPWRQTFPADEFTKKLIPRAAGNAWTLAIDPDARELRYSLDRGEEKRFRAVFDLSMPVGKEPRTGDPHLPGVSPVLTSLRGLAYRRIGARHCSASLARCDGLPEGCESRA